MLYDHSNKLLYEGEFHQREFVKKKIKIKKLNKNDRQKVFFIEVFILV